MREAESPFSSFANVESDHQLDGLFSCIRRHLSPQGKCILNAFNPNRSREAMKLEWCKDEESFQWEVTRNNRRYTCHERRPRLDSEKMVLYPELIYRTYEGNELIDEKVLRITVRCHYPDEFEALIRSQGFAITNRWGGYTGESYGEGPELIIECR